MKSELILIILGAAGAGVLYFLGRYLGRFLGENFNIPIIGELFRKSPSANNRDRNRRIKTIRDNINSSRDQNNRIRERISGSEKRIERSEELAGDARTEVRKGLQIIRGILGKRKSGKNK